MTAINSAFYAKPAVIWAGRILSAIPVLMMLMSAVMKFMQPPELVETFTGKFGYGSGSLIPIGLLELTCIILYAIPRTSILGAILVAAYLGGATATHVRVGDPFLGPVIVGVFAWAGLYLRDARVRALIPLKSKPQSAT